MVGTATINEDMLKRRWSARILRYLDRGVTDPAEITKTEANLSPSVMSQRLRTMLRYSLIARYPRAAPSKVVEFRITARGKKILKMLDVIDQLDQLDQHLALNGKPVEEDLGLAITQDSSRPRRVEPVAPEKPVKRKQSSSPSSLPNPSKQSVP